MTMNTDEKLSLTLTIGESLNRGGMASKKDPHTRLHCRFGRASFNHVCWPTCRNLQQNPNERGHNKRNEQFCTDRHEERQWGLQSPSDCIVALVERISITFAYPHVVIFNKIPMSEVTTSAMSSSAQTDMKRDNGAHNPRPMCQRPMNSDLFVSW
jgi:hypothetical protein